MERICTKCGNPIEGDDSFCDNCGTKYEDAAIDDAVKEQNKADKKVKKKTASEKSEKTTEMNQALEGFISGNKKKLIGVVVALAVIVAAIFVIRGLAANTPEGALKKAVDCRLSGNIEGSADLDYDCNFSLNETRESAIALMKGNAELTKDHKGEVTLRIKSENRLTDDERAGTKDFSNRIAELKASYRDTDSITDIRQFSYDLMDGKTVKYSGFAEAIRADGKWYIRGVAEAAYNL